MVRVMQSRYVKKIGGGGGGGRGLKRLHVMSSKKVFLPCKEDDRPDCRTRLIAEIHNVLLKWITKEATRFAKQTYHCLQIL